MAAALTLGNTATRFDQKRYTWVFYVRGAVEYVDHVVVNLHPTFKNPVRTLTGPAFELKSRGWGTFELDVVIHWKGGGEQAVSWTLQFHEKDASTTLQIPPALVARASTQESRPPPAPPQVVAPQVVAAAPLPVPEEVAAPDEEQLIPSDAADEEEVPGLTPSADGLDGLEDLGMLTLSRHCSAESYPEECCEEPEAEEPSSGVAVPSVEAPVEDATAERLTFQENLRKDFLRHTDPQFMHGRGYSGPLTLPRMTWRCDEPPRDDHDAPKWLTASEYCDEAAVMECKCAQLARLMRLSRKTVAYTGAGISAAVIGQAARSGANKVGWKADTRKAKPTFTHYALGFLGQNGMIHSWVQQNHDGLPQKAGFPQEKINEIHGSWYDPSNPVVKYSGSLHDRSYPWMVNDAATADLVLVLGTSLGGLNADQVATEAAKRSCHDAALGTVIMNLQQTEQDGKMTLRFFGKSDDILRSLLKHLGHGRIELRPPQWPAESRMLVPYDKDGKRCSGKKMWLDLSDGQKIRITPGHNIQGAKQPQYMHIGARRAVTYKGSTRQPGVGLGTVTKRCEDSSSYILQVEGEMMRLGIWWLVSAAIGGVDALPIVNQKPQFQ